MKHKNVHLVFAAALCFVSWTAVAQEQTPGSQKLLAQVKEQSTSDALTQQSQRALSRFYGDLAQLEDGKKTQVTILQLGDSHTANDFLSGQLRARFQQRFGNAGRGMMPPGVVYKGINEKDIKPSQDEGWVIENSLKNPEHGPYGISGFVARSITDGAHMQLSATDPVNGFDEASVDYLLQPDGGKFEVLIDGRMAAFVSTRGAAGQSKSFALQLPRRAHDMTVIALRKGITLTAWSTSRRDHGVLLVSHGVVGAKAELSGHWNPDIMKSDITHLKPSLIIVAYGTNEGFEDNFKPDQYAQMYAGLLATLRRLAPEASILVVGPPDSEHIEAGCRMAKLIPALCGWQRPPALEAVRAIQRNAAREAGADFWDWSGIMPRGMADWVKNGWGRPDHVHFKIPGYEATADQLFDRLMTGYNFFNSHNQSR